MRSASDRKEIQRLIDAALAGDAVAQREFQVLRREHESNNSIVILIEGLKNNIIDKLANVLRLRFAIDARCAYTVEDALALVAGSRPSGLLIVVNNLPPTAGEELVTRALATHPGCRILLCSGGIDSVFGFTALGDIVQRRALPVPVAEIVAVCAPHLARRDRISESPLISATRPAREIWTFPSETARDGRLGAYSSGGVTAASGPAASAQCATNQVGDEKSFEGSRVDPCSRCGALKPSPPDPPGLCTACAASLEAEEQARAGWGPTALLLRFDHLVDSRIPDRPHNPSAKGPVELLWRVFRFPLGLALLGLILNVFYSKWPPLESFGFYILLTLAVPFVLYFAIVLLALVEMIAIAMRRSQWPERLWFVLFLLWFLGVPASLALMDGSSFARAFDAFPMVAQIAIAGIGFVIWMLGIAILLGRVSATERAQNATRVRRPN